MENKAFLYSIARFEGIRYELEKHFYVGIPAEPIKRYSVRLDNDEKKRNS